MLAAVMDDSRTAAGIVFSEAVDVLLITWNA